MSQGLYFAVDDANIRHAMAGGHGMRWHAIGGSQESEEDEAKPQGEVIAAHSEQG